VAGVGALPLRRLRPHLGERGYLRLMLCLIVAASAGTTALDAGEQDRPDAAPAMFEFDAASVKPNVSGARQRSIGFQPGGRFVARNMPLRFVIGVAYGDGPSLPPYLIVDGPDWLETDPYDIDAVAERGALEGLDAAGRASALRAMLRELLAQRFNLRARWEPRERAVYALVRARSDGQLGDGLRRSVPDECISPLSPPADAGSLPTCGAGPMNQGVLTGYGMTMLDFARTLQFYLDRPVLDQTALTGKFTITLRFVLELPSGPTPGDTSIFAALPEQLGLKLDPERASVNVLVIDVVERPAPD
jgi:uncharacterized protein (TIGR03435 family)